MASIERRVALLSPERLGLSLRVFVSIEAGDHSPDWLARFESAVTSFPEVVEVHRMAGDIGYMCGSSPETSRLTIASTSG